ncbi:hypothetical protein QBC44DRAFT_305313 [Cladorrhinum sp. PSN332]|nr:hypothetical protein QBC44DRAFT_305313 [Cladorrhinum sp. PSN332]
MASQPAGVPPARQTWAPPRPGSSLAATSFISSSHRSVTPPSEDHFTKDRPPHINPDNMSSGQVASASSEHALLFVPKKLDSNKCSTETPGTDGTQIKGDHATAIPNMGTERPQDPNPSYPNNINEWVTEAGLGGKFNRNYAPSAYSATSSRSQLSTASSVASRDWAFVVQPSSIDVALTGNGAWCELSIGPPVPASGSLILDQE